MFQHLFNQVRLELNMTQRVGKTSLGLLQAPTLRAASKEELSAAGNTEQAGAASAWGRPRRGQPPRFCRAFEIQSL